MEVFERLAKEGRVRDEGQMKEIIKVSCNDKEFHIIIDGDNIDLLTSIAEIIRKIEKQNNISTATSIQILKNMLKDDEQMKGYKYGYKLRPPSIGTQPKGFLSLNAERYRGYWG